LEPSPEPVLDASFPGLPLIESPFFPQLVDAAGLDAREREVAEALHRDGHAVIDFPEPELERLADEIRRAIAPQFDWAGWLRDRSNKRFPDLWDSLPAVRRIAANAGIRALLSKLYGRPAFPFQTLNFLVGTEQHPHSDAIHFHSVPERFMCGVWVALEDVGPENGPLIYWPGSHRLQVYSHEQLGLAAPGGQLPYERFWEALMAAHGLRPRHLHARRGQAVIWTANLMHGGSAQRDRSRTRLSQVTHYYFERCAWYMPHSTDFILGRVARKQVRDVATGEVVPAWYAGMPLEQAPPPWFDAAAYLEANPDVAAAGADPLTHWLNHGQAEGRRLRP
jgi:hypothetical protein